MHLLDANVLIEAKNTYYRFGIAPGFWQWLRDAHRSGQVASVPAVKQELLAQEDELASWARRLPDSFWIPESAATVDALRSLAVWTMQTAPLFTIGARTDFLASADYRLIAEAIAGSHFVVTREQPAPRAVKRVKIPDVCAALGVVVTSPFDAYSALGLELR